MEHRALNLLYSSDMHVRSSGGIVTRPIPVVLDDTNSRISRYWYRSQPNNKLQNCKISHDGDAALIVDQLCNVTLK